MTRFISGRDERFFQSINNELINKIVETEIILYKTIIEDSNPKNIYGESTERTYYVGTNFNCLINRSNQEASSDNFGQNTFQNIEIAINREFIREKNVYPENGDIIFWNNFYYQIDNVIENQYIAGRKETNWSFVCSGHLTNVSQLNILERTQ